MELWPSAQCRPACFHRYVVAWPVMEMALHLRWAERDLRLTVSHSQSSRLLRTWLNLFRVEIERQRKDTQMIQ
jgi:hypothetical protein